MLLFLGAIYIAWVFHAFPEHIVFITWWVGMALRREVYGENPEEYHRNRAEFQRLVAEVFRANARRRARFANV